MADGAEYNYPFMSTYHGLHGHFTAQPGQDDALTEILLAAADGLRAWVPGSHLIAFHHG